MISTSPGTQHQSFFRSLLMAIVKGENINVKELKPWIARFEDIFVNQSIFVPAGITNGQLRERVAHSLGHHFMHNASLVWIKGFDSNWRPGEEAQASEYAAYLLIPDLDRPTAEDVDPAVLAEQFNVTEQLAALRIELAKAELPP